ncbi:MAG: TfoX/Sxy family protein [Bacteroidetes bacterium]|jgi:DNA transformation protein|nr:TfoX/Sxy family protein [Bacteroidota bacterium]
MNAKNIGKAIEKRLNKIGVYNLAYLAEMSPKEAYRKICEQNPNKTIPKCYYLYSLQGALIDLDWRELPEEIKTELRK